MFRIQSLLIKRGYIAWEIFLRQIKVVIGEFNVSGKFLQNKCIQRKKSRKIFEIYSVCIVQSLRTLHYRVYTRYLRVNWVFGKLRNL